MSEVIKYPYVVIEPEIISIVDSYTVKKHDFQAVLKHIEEKHDDETYVFQYRSKFSMKMEWAVHNFCYNLNILPEKTRSVEFEIPMPWIIRLGYDVCGMISWMFIK